MSYIWEFKKLDTPAHSFIRSTKNQLTNQIRSPHCQDVLKHRYCNRFFCLFFSFFFFFCSFTDWLSWVVFMFNWHLSTVSLSWNPDPDEADHCSSGWGYNPLLVWLWPEDVARQWVAAGQHRSPGGLLNIHGYHGQTGASGKIREQSLSPEKNRQWTPPGSNNGWATCGNIKGQHPSHE